ncbi:DNA glycosylase [Selenomonas sp. TAMA-11512]|uniref:DNA glycosylase n=1 Tax=Selenomonas sp. TAMA-11512 TaxID=3095337 RepID=UPI00308D1602|nr:DNA glycosylase [Selenomonas sp. TAMA-11512]
MTDEHDIELRPFPPFLPPNATVMMMGTFPPAAEKRTMEFHYPNFQNDMWRVYGLVFFGEAMHFQRAGEKAFDAERIKAFLTERGIASCPTVRRAIRGHGNASDAFLEVVETVDLPAVLEEIPHCRRICTTGGKASEILLSLVETDVKAKDFKTGMTIEARCDARGLLITRMPSTSRAYPMKLEKKAEAYRKFFVEAGILTANRI